MLIVKEKFVEKSYESAVHSYKFSSFYFLYLSLLSRYPRPLIVSIIFLSNYFLKYLLDVQIRKGVKQTLFELNLLLFPDIQLYVHQD